MKISVVGRALVQQDKITKINAGWCIKNLIIAFCRMIGPCWAKTQPTLIKTSRQVEREF